MEEIRSSETSVFHEPQDVMSQKTAFVRVTLCLNCDMKHWYRQQLLTQLTPNYVLQDSVSVHRELNVCKSPSGCGLTMKTMKKKKKREVGSSERHYGWGKQNISSVLKVPRHCPFVLLVILNF
jgi:hypothetical protein